MNKLIFKTIILIFTFNFSFSQVKTKDSLIYIPNKFVENLLAKNDSLKIAFEKTKSKLTKAQIDNIFTKAENKEYDIKKTRIALELTSKLGDNWHFDNSIKPENSLVLKSTEDLENFAKSIPLSKSVTYDTEGNIQKLEIIYKNNTKEIIEKITDGTYQKRTIDEKGKEKIEPINDISEFERLNIKTE